MKWARTGFSVGLALAVAACSSSAAPRAAPWAEAATSTTVSYHVVNGRSQSTTLPLS